MTSWGKGEGSDHEKEMAVHRSGGASGDGAVHVSRGHDREAAVELAAAAALRLAPDHVLAGARSAGALPHPVRRLRALRAPLQHAPADVRALGENVPRGPGAASAGP